MGVSGRNKGAMFEQGSRVEISGSNHDGAVMIIQAFNIDID